MSSWFFFSKKLNETESLCSTFDQELLTIYLSIQHICHFCEGRPFLLWTNHKPSVTVLSRVTVPILPHQRCHLVFISESNVQMFYLPNLQNVVADFLSQPCLPSQSTDDAAAAAAAPPINFKEMAAEQNQCTETQRLLGRTSLTIVPTSWQSPPSQQCLNRGFRPVVRNKFQQDIFSHLHNISHPHGLASCPLVLSRYFWSGLAWDMAA